MILVDERRLSSSVAMRSGILLLAMVVVAAAAAPPSGDICKRCSCAAAGTVTCECTASNKLQYIMVEPNSFADSSGLRKFEVRGCQSVTFLTNALRDAYVLETLSVINVVNVSFEMGVFHTLDSLVIDSVSSLILKKSAFQGAKNISNILIRKSTIPLIPKWALYNLPDVKEIRIEDTVINKIETEAVLIDMPHHGSNAVIHRSELGTVEERGVQIGNATDIQMNGCLIEQAVANSIRLSSWHSMTLNGNIINKDVAVDSILVLYNRSLVFTDNILKNIEIKMSEGPHAFFNKTSSTLERLAFENRGNQIPCECSHHITNTSGEFFRNLCLGGCQEATLNSFLFNCQENVNMTTSAILKKICSGKVPLTTPPAPTASPMVNSTPKSKSSSSQLNVNKMTAYLTQLCIIIFYLIL